MISALSSRALPAAVLAVLAFANIVLPWRVDAQRPASKRASTDGFLPLSRRPIDIDLITAALHGDLTAARSLLKRGANPNARDSVYATALEDSSSLEITEALLKAGADPNSVSPYGTPLLAASLGGSAPTVLLLLAHGAHLNVVRPDGITPLMLASRAGAIELMKALLQRKVDVNARDNGGETALIHAIRDGQLEAVQVLLAARASTSLADSSGRTPLMHAAMVGRTDLIRALIAAKADPNAHDLKGMTALMLASACGDRPDAVKALMEAGADTNARDSHSRTATAIALQRGFMETARLLGADASATNEPAAPMRSPKDAVRKGLATIQQSMLAFNKRTGCISCHHEGLGRMATGVAMSHDFTCDSALERIAVQRIDKEINRLHPLHRSALTRPEMMKQIPSVDFDDLSMYYGFILGGMEAHRQPSTLATTAMTMVLARQQQPDGHWQFGGPRVPMESSFFTLTAMAVQALHTYGKSPYAKEADACISRARSWLLKTPTQTSEDRAFRLLGLKWSGAADADIRKAVADLSADQRPDGGWS